MTKSLTEKWKDVVGYEGLYKVSSFGNILSSYSNKLLKPKKERNGYVRVALVKNKKVKYFSVHRLVLTAFVQNTENKNTINHKDGNKLNNHLSNLEWATSKENITHAWNNGMNDWHKKRVVCLETGVVYDTIKKASEMTKATKTGITHCLSGRYKTSGGLSWSILKSGV